MAESAAGTKNKLSFRVCADREGRVHLSLDGLAGEEVVVQRPVTLKTLEAAKSALVEAILLRLSERGEPRGTTAGAGAPSDPQRHALAEIAAALSPPQADNLLARARSWVGSALIVLIQVFMTLVLISFAYKGVQYSSETLPAPLHLVVLALYTAAIVLGTLAIATEESRRRWGSAILEWFGPRGFIVLPCLILVTAAAVFASFTFFLYARYPSLLSLPSGAPGAATITEGRLMDFYMWHFLKLVPFLNINEVLKWTEPLHYDGALVGTLILLFQGAVVIPSIAAIRSYWKTKEASKPGTAAPVRSIFVQE